jgi:hypothetical protein
MDVGLEGVLLTSHIYSCTQSMVPYSGDNELGATWSDPRMRAGTWGGVGEHGALRDRWSLRVRVALLDMGFVPEG